MPPPQFSPVSRLAYCGPRRRKDGTQMAATIATFENDVRFAGKSTEVAIGRKKPGVAVAHSARDYAQGGPPCWHWWDNPPRTVATFEAFCFCCPLPPLAVWVNIPPEVGPPRWLGPMSRGGGCAPCMSHCLHATCPECVHIVCVCVCATFCVLHFLNILFIF